MPKTAVANRLLLALAVLALSALAFAGPVPTPSDGEPCVVTQRIQLTIPCGGGKTITTWSTVLSTIYKTTTQATTKIQKTTETTAVVSYVTIKETEVG